MGYAGAEIKKNHLAFKEILPERFNKLYRYVVSNEDLHHEIGIIHWRGGWRQYVFQALPEIDMSRGCMKEIIIFIDKLMQDWRSK